MSRNTDGLADNLAADLAAVRKEVARLVDAWASSSRPFGTRERASPPSWTTPGPYCQRPDDASGRVRALNGDLVATVERHPWQPC